MLKASKWVSSYYPFGLTMAGISWKKPNVLENRFRYNGKELQSQEFSDKSGLELYDYGARFYDQQIGRWHKTDNKAELYFANSLYVYSLNQPTNAIDPDGNLVIFINGMHGGNGGTTGYWNVPNNYKIFVKNGNQPPAGYHFIGSHLNSSSYGKDFAFDEAVMNQLNDHHAIYKDGAIGGISSLFGLPNNPLNASDRYDAGKTQGAKDAKSLIDNLARDKSGNISETIKIITHSMGGVYGSGYLAAMQDYIKTLPLTIQQQIKITLVADFDPFQASSITANPNIKTTQYKHSGNSNIIGMGWLANENEKGLDPKTNIISNSGNSTNHAISSFINDIFSLSEGFYKWDGNKFVKQ